MQWVQLHWLPAPTIFYILPCILDVLFELITLTLNSTLHIIVTYAPITYDLLRSPCANHLASSLHNILEWDLMKLNVTFIGFSSKSGLFLYFLAKIAKLEKLIPVQMHKKMFLF